MSLRPTQSSTYSLVRSGIQLNLAKLARAQQEIATGKRILAPSDDSIGTSVSMSIRRQETLVQSWVTAIETARPQIASASSQLQTASGLMTGARARILEGMNGALAPSDREAVAIQLELLYDGLLELSNSRSGDRYLFAGTAADQRPFVETVEGGRHVVRYAGDAGEHAILVGREQRIQINVPGDAVFAANQFAGARVGSVTGVRLGASANSGDGYHDLRLRHDATLGAPGAGIALADGGADDTILGDHGLVVDSASRTVQLGSGKSVPIPDPLPARLAVRDADGSEVVLDLTGWTGADASAVLTGQGSIALNDGAFVPLAFTETDLRLVDETSGAVLHVDATGVTRAATELVTFSGAANLFDTLRGVIDDLRNGELLPQELHARLEERLGEFDRNQRNLLVNLGRLGSREQRLNQTEERHRDLSVHLEALRSSIEDADMTEVALELGRAEQTLQVAQATGARLIQQSLLNYLR